MPFRRLQLADLSVGTSITGLACVRQKELRTTKGGDPFLCVEVRNATGGAAGKIWKERVGDWDGIMVGDAVSLTATVKPGYQGGPPELDIIEVAQQGEHPVRLELNPVCPTPLQELEERFGALSGQLSSPVRELLDVVLEHAGPERFWTAPAAKMHHHAYVRGLVEHSIEVAEIACRTCEIASYRDHVDRDALIIGALLHDLGKVVEYEWVGCPIDISAAGRLQHHTVTGPEMVAVAVSHHGNRLRAAGVRGAMVQSLKHIQASHHGRPEWGSSVEPATPEAVIIHMADMMSAKVRGALDDVTSAKPDKDGWVQPVGFRKRPILYAAHVTRSRA